jgi:hypothetical protein
MKLPFYSQFFNNNKCHLPKCQNIFHQYTTDATRYVTQNTPQLKIQIYGVVADVRQNSNRSLPTFKCSIRQKDTVQFLPYGRSIGSWMSYTQDVYMSHVTMLCVSVIFFFFMEQLCTTTQNVHEESCNGSSQLFYRSLQHVMRAHSSGRSLQHVMRAHSSGR